MRPRLFERCEILSTNDFSGTYETLLSVLSSFDCSSYFSDLLGKAQCEQKIIVDSFKNNLCRFLVQELPTLHWLAESPSSKLVKDSIDIFGSNDDCCIIIEIDKHRADQVAKKYVSRAAVTDRRNIYIALCYPGTNNMNLNECAKYFNYCKNLSLRLNNLYAGYVISKTHVSPA